MFSVTAILVCPLAALALLAAGVFVLWLRRIRRSRHGEAPRCLRCGYDLTGQEVPRCPECGALRGFRVPLTNLGLSDAEVRDGFGRTRRERVATPGAPPPEKPHHSGCHGE